MTVSVVRTDHQRYQALDASIKTAHAEGRLDLLANDYARSAALYEDRDGIDAACFYWTQAYITALDAGAHSLAKAMHDRLEAFGRMG